MAVWVLRRWNKVKHILKDAEGLLRTLNIFLLCFGPYKFLIDDLQGNKMTCCDVAPLLFQTMFVMMNTKDKYPQFFQHDKDWSIAHKYALTALWQRSFGGPHRDVIIAAYAVTLCGRASLRASFAFFFFFLGVAKHLIQFLLRAFDVHCICRIVSTIPSRDAPQDVRRLVSATTHRVVSTS
jgi:hypothetical protein